MDEYLQATRLGLELNRITLSLDLTPGVAIAPQLLRSLDSDSNGRISRQEENNYVDRVLQDLRLEVDGQTMVLKRASVRFPRRSEMEEGEGVIQIKVVAKAAPLTAGTHEVLFENRHRPDISVYLVNALVPANKAIRITRQIRDEEQKRYRLEFTVSDPASTQSRQIRR